MKHPEVSIIIPTYNREKTIARAVKSVLNQTFEDFELIIVDDGSTDKTEEIVLNFKDRRLKYIKQKENNGANFCRNRGIELSKGKYLAFQDSDAEWLPTKLGKQIKSIKSAKSDVGVIYTSFLKINDFYNVIVPKDDWRRKSGKIYNSLSFGNFVDTSTVLIKKECFKNCGKFDPSLPRLQDWELFLRMSKNMLFYLLMSH